MTPPEIPTEAHVVQVNVSRGGIPKLPITQGTLGAAGLDGDACRNLRYHGGPLQAVLLIALEAIDELRAAGFPVFPGALGENITTRGLDYRELTPGQRIMIGDAQIELTKVRTPCKTLDMYGSAIKKAIYDKKVKAGDRTSAVWGKSGFYARVIRGGRIVAGTIIRLDSIAA
jgi:MOSC domain-containing protein YiiM